MCVFTYMKSIMRIIVTGSRCELVERPLVQPPDSLVNAHVRGVFEKILAEVLT